MMGTFAHSAGTHDIGWGWWLCLIGILLSALFQRYVPEDLMVNVFGGNEAWGVLMAATLGVPLYACGGGTIPLLREWLWAALLPSCSRGPRRRSPISGL